MEILVRIGVIRGTSKEQNYLELVLSYIFFIALAVYLHCTNDIEQDTATISLNLESVITSYNLS